MNLTGKQYKVPQVKMTPNQIFMTKWAIREMVTQHLEWIKLHPVEKDKKVMYNGQEVFVSDAQYETIKKACK